MFFRTQRFAVTFNVSSMTHVLQQTGCSSPPKIIVSMSVMLGSRCGNVPCTKTIMFSFKNESCLETVSVSSRVACCCLANMSCWSLCVGCAIVQADNAPDCGVAQGVIHGVPIHHGEKQEEEEGEVEQEVEGNKEEDNNQTPVRMSMDEME